MIHVITPFSRAHLWYSQVEQLLTKNVQWHPIVVADALIPDYAQLHWIHPHLVTFTEKDVFDICYAKLQHWLDTAQIIDDDYYVFMCDDDGYTPNFFDQLRSCSADVVWVTVYGRTIVQNPSPPNLRVGSCGLRSYCVKGRVAKQMRFDQTQRCADGLMAMWLHANVDSQAWRPDMIVLYNYFEPGRWTDPVWRGP